MKSRFIADGFTAEKPDYSIPYTVNDIAAMLDVRLLFSCLTDADFIDTEAHFNGDEKGKRYRDSGPKLDYAAAVAALERHMERVRVDNRADANVLAARESLWAETLRAAETEPGLFTLTAPTGSGKTLAMLHFALRHAARRDLRRIVMVIPYLTIIEQTARIYREVFGGFPENFVLEHHSLAGFGRERAETDQEGRTGEEERWRRLLAENWDAPVILTTNVQLLESLFSNRPAACRKLHRLMGSVILFDEAQTLPLELALPTLAALSHLSRRYRTSIVFATATQPAFDHLDSAVRGLIRASGWQPKPVVPNESQLFDQLRRVRVHWPQKGEQTTWKQLAVSVHEHPKVLCVVNLKRHAAELVRLLGDGDDIFHLSTNMCPAHRREVLDAVRQRLKSEEACRLISTQCVEAGVDVDFPVVFRAMAPLDGIAQAAGRCNRNGLLRDAQGAPLLGEVFVIKPSASGEKEQRCYPTFDYWQAASITELMLRSSDTGELDIHDPRVFRAYYERLYALSKPELKSQDLRQAVQAAEFAGVAEQYRLIREDTISVMVPYPQQIESYRALVTKLDGRGLTADWMRRAQPLSVSLFRPKPDHPLAGLLVAAKLPRGGTSDEWFILGEEFAKYYDPVRGLDPPDGQTVLIA